MFTALFAFVFNIATINAPATQCETYAANDAGVRVTVCAGSVVNACDASGHCTSDDK